MCSQEPMSKYSEVHQAGDEGAAASGRREGGEGRPWGGGSPPHQPHRPCSPRRDPDPTGQLCGPSLGATPDPPPRREPGPLRGVGSALSFRGRVRAERNMKHFD